MKTTAFICDQCGVSLTQCLTVQARHADTGEATRRGLSPATQAFAAERHFCDLCCAYTFAHGSEGPSDVAIARMLAFRASQ